MTKEHANELKVGFVVLVCLALGIGIALKLSNWDQWFEPKNTLTFKVPYRAGIGGIKPGWPVTIGGVNVGSVETILLKLEERDPRDIEDETLADQKQPTDDSGPRTYSYFTFTVPSRYRLREDCKLTPASQLIGGAGELVISDLGRGELLQDGQVVFRKSLGGSSMAAVMDTVQEAVENIRKITEDFKDVSGKARETVSLTKPQLEKIISNVRAASVEMKEGMREIRWNPWRLLHNPTDRELRTQNLLTAARAFSSGASDVDTAVGKLEGLLSVRGDGSAMDDPDVQQMVEELRATMVKFSEAADTFFKRLGKGK
ncbi:MAG: hypothetical protein GWP14_08455 [Actinobacteria bacterium]|nr:hypothetical protein [Actinomycetota bacterium]